MQQLASSGAVASFSAERDKLPPNTMCTRMRIVSRVPTVLPGGHTATGGECEVLIPDRDQVSLGLLDRVKEMAWDAHEAKRIEEAREDFERGIDEEVAATGPTRDVLAVQGVREKVVAACGRPDIDPQSEKLFAADLTNAEKEIHAHRCFVYTDTGSSVEGAFYKRYRRGINPIIKADIIDENVPVPEQYEAKRADSTMTEELLRGLMSVLQPGAQSDQSAEIASLKEQIARLEELVTSPAKKK